MLWVQIHIILYLIISNDILKIYTNTRIKLELWWFGKNNKRKIVLAIKIEDLKGRSY